MLPMGGTLVHRGLSMLHEAMGLMGENGKGARAAYDDPPQT